MVNISSSPELLYSISQVNAITGVPKSTIRFWEKEFSEFLIPERTTGNQRRYDAGTVEKIKEIDNLVIVEGFTLVSCQSSIDG